MNKQFRGIYIGKGKRDRVGRDGINYGMTGIFTNQPQMWPEVKYSGPLWTFCPDGTWKSFVVFIEDIYQPTS